MISYEPPLLHGGVHGDQEQKNISVTVMQLMTPRGKPCNKVALYKKTRPGSLQRTFRTSRASKPSGSSRREEAVPEDLHVNPSYAFKKSSMFDDNRDKQRKDQRGARGTNDLRPLSVVFSWFSFRRHQASNSTETE